VTKPGWSEEYPAREPENPTTSGTGQYLCERRGHKNRFPRETSSGPTTHIQGEIMEGLRTRGGVGWKAKVGRGAHEEGRAPAKQVVIGPGMRSNHANMQD